MTGLQKQHRQDLPLPKQKTIKMKTIFALIAVTFLSTLFVQPSKSQTQHSPQAYEEVNRYVSYLGTRNEMLVFQVNLNFNDKEIKTLSIYDETGNEIYTERITSNIFTKQYVFAKNLAGKLQFTLRGKKQLMNETFQIKYKTQETLEITKS